MMSSFFIAAVDLRRGVQCHVAPGFTGTRGPCPDSSQNTNLDLTFAHLMPLNGVTSARLSAVGRTLSCGPSKEVIRYPRNMISWRSGVRCHWVSQYEAQLRSNEEAWRKARHVLWRVFKKNVAVYTHAMTSTQILSLAHLILYSILKLANNAA